MPLFSDTASAIKSRFGFHDRTAASSSSSEMSSTMPSVKSTPDLHLKSALKNTSEILNRTLSAGGLDFDEDDYQTTSCNRSFEFHEDPSFWKDQNVQVIIRLRPLSNSEISVQGHSRCVRQDSSQSITWTGHPESRFTFDLVADENVSQEMLFNMAGVPMVENCMGGYNSCMFAYGQTGSGKTHTMLGDIEGGTRRHSVNCGMTPRVFEFLFSRIQKEREARREEKIKFTCRCSFLEIYNEQILDLLDPSSANLQLREDSKKGIYVENLTEVEVASARDVIHQLLQGATNRKVAATNMNHASSRSHCVFTCTIESKWESQGVTHHRFARLNLVDLAGSERQKSSGAEGERLKEATNINKSLSTLGLVIMNLVNISNGKSLHVPYRDSKLTFLLQDSLGGNAKTIIIANISPSSCCSLETLSTLKFAQRAKYIKNHAIVNEDASGDVLAMRIQIQNLKKEVSRLRSLVNGGAESHENEGLAVSFPGSPGTFKWEGLHGLSSPLLSDKRMSQKKEYEVALVGAFRREKDKDIKVQALVAENQAAMQLAKQREDEIQSLKMRLRFREAGIKRLEAVASGKISAETHLLQEKEEHLKEIEVLRSQVDRNKEATRFAMENLRLKEEIRRLKSFCEEGECERMNEQITTLQNKLLEALDWKLMHEAEPSVVQNGNSEKKIVSGDDILLASQGGASPWCTSINEENEFLRLQAIQNQSELNSLQKNLDLCVEEKEKLQRYVNDLEMQMEAEKSSKAAMTQQALKMQIEVPSLVNSQMPNIAASDQIELKTMVDAIAAASQREAEAHETAIFLSKENDELKMKLKVLLEDNNKLIELYEQAVAENNTDCREKQTGKEQLTKEGNKQFSQVAEEDMVMKAEVENLKNQLGEMHDENDKLMGLYEKAMQERDEFKRLFAAYNEQKNIEIRGEYNCPEKLVEIDGGDNLKCDESCVSVDEKSRALEAGPFGGVHMGERIYSQLEDHALSGDAEGLMEEAELYEVNVHDCYTPCSVIKTEGPESEEVSRTEVGKVRKNELSGQSAKDGVTVVVESALSSGGLISEESHLPEFSVISSNEDHEKFNTSNGHQKSGMDLEIDARLSDVTKVKFSEDMDLVRKKLVEAQEKLSSSALMMGIFGSLERALLEFDELSGEIERLENSLHVKHQEYASSKLLYSQMHERKVLLHRKLTALKYSLSSFSTSISYFEQREAQVRARLNASTVFLNQKKDALAHLQVQKDEILESKMKTRQAEVELKNHMADLKSKMEEEIRRLENYRVLFAIDNLEKAEGHPVQRNWHLGGKAAELLKSEEEKTKLQNLMKQNLERLGVMKKEYEDLKKKLVKVESEIHVVQKDIEDQVLLVEDFSQKLQNVITEKEMVLDMKESGRNEFENMFIEYHECMIGTVLKEEEIRILDEELLVETRNIEDMKREKVIASSRKSQLLKEVSCQSCLVSDKIQEDLHSISMALADLAFGENGRQ